jgi:hypothetical protein
MKPGNCIKFGDEENMELEPCTRIGPAGRVVLCAIINVSGPMLEDTAPFRPIAQHQVDISPGALQAREDTLTMLKL